MTTTPSVPTPPPLFQVFAQKADYIVKILPQRWELAKAQYLAFRDEGYDADAYPVGATMPDGTVSCAGVLRKLY